MEAGTSQVRVALFIEGAGEALAEAVTSSLASAGIQAHLDVFPLDSLFRCTEGFRQSLVTLAPKYAVIVPTTQKLKASYYTSQQHELLAQDMVKHFVSCWGELFNLGTSVIQCLYALPTEKFHGMHERSDLSSLIAVTSSLNTLLQTEAPRLHVRIADVDRLSSELGRQSWHDPRAWAIAELPFTDSAKDALSGYLAQIIQSMEGQVIKAIVLDLDQTLWPEILDEVSSDGLLTSATSNLFLEFQSFLLEIKKRGVLLAICSKNDEAQVRKVFQTNQRLRLKEADFAWMEVSWQEKALGVEKISQGLKVHPSQMLFVDDSAFERGALKAAIAAVHVLDTSLDPLDNIARISAENFFDSGALTPVDAKRGRAQRDATVPLEQYLLELEMVLTISPIGRDDWPRLAQLSQRANQFNMMTARSSVAEVQSLAQQPGHQVLKLQLADRQEDLGVIGVLHLSFSEKTLTIEDWIMSCRSFSRQLEEAVMAWLMEAAAARGADVIQGRIRPQERNKFVHGLYQTLGFQRVAVLDGTETWQATRWSAQYPATVKVVHETELTCKKN